MAETIIKIDTHVVDALKRLLEQYKEADNLNGVITALAQQFQDEENTTFDLVAGREIATAVGVQLDLLGTIIGVPRIAGQSDEDYRISLFVKIGQNTSQGEPEKIISVYKLLTNANSVFYQNLTDASIMLSTDVDIDPTNDPDMVRFIYASIEKVVAGGVRIDYLECFSPDDDSFAFAGNNANVGGLGFGNTLDSGAGGKFARIHRRLTPFAFDGLTVDQGGFGSTVDPLQGGTFVTT